ncbi:hypothetical protein [Halomonas sp. 18071143]|uniref:hypothetical protein n=1 Tax=Halomonas sp. 18071143 TaxID=2855441 RepID=UPI001C47530A|nr:hypothetical protein [Halomonas sp. 18071143]
MNFAVCMSGHPRTFDRTAAKIFEVFRGADFYFSTWDSDYNQQLTSLFESYNVNLMAYEFVKEPSQLHNERKICELFANSYPDFFILNQWYGVARSIALAHESSFIHGKKYDLIFRCRFDLNFKFNFDDLICKQRKGTLNYIEALTKGSDQFFFGETELMTQLMNLPEWLVDYGNQFGNNFGFFASPLIKAFFLDQGYDLNKIKLPMTVLRPKGESASAHEIREKRTRDYIARHFPDLKHVLWSGDRSKDIKCLDLKRPAPWDKEYYNGKRNFYVDGE